MLHINYVKMNDGLYDKLFEKVRSKSNPYKQIKLYELHDYSKELLISKYPRIVNHKSCKALIPFHLSKEEANKLKTIEVSKVII